MRVSCPNLSVNSVNEELAVLITTDVSADANCFGLGVGYTVCL